MTKAKALLGLAGALCAFSLMVVPAGAWFKSLNGTTSGNGHSIGAIIFAGGGAELSCKGAVGGWQIETLTKQEPTTEGQHELISVSKWGTCVSVKPFEGALEVSPCSFQLEQISKSSIPIGQTAKQSKECIIKAALGCEIKVPTTNNQKLKEWKGTNNSKNDKVVFNASGITDAVNFNCEVGGISAVNNATLKGELENEAQNFV